MRKLFSFKSSGNADDITNPTDPSGEKVFWEKPWQSDTEDASGNNSLTPSDSFLGFSKGKDASVSRLRRSLSFSSPTVYGESGGGCMEFLVNQSESSPRCSNASLPDDDADCAVHSWSLTPERPSRSRRRDLAVARKTNSPERIDSSNLLTEYQSSSGNSPRSSPVPLRCRASRVTRFSNKNKILDLYIDGEHLEGKGNSQMFPASIGDDGCLVENRILVNSGCLPQAHSTDPSSPTYSKENLMAHTIRNVKDFQDYLSNQDWAVPASPQKPNRKFVRRLSHAFHGKSKLKLQEHDSETNTIVEDIYEDTQNPDPHLVADNTAQNHCLSDQPYSYETVSDYCSQDSLNSHKQNCYLEESPWRMKNEEELDRELHMRLKEAEQRFRSISEFDVETQKFQNGNFSASSLLEMIKDINRDRRNLALDLLTQMQCRVAERSSAKEALKQAKTDLITRTRRLEKEKSELQSSLEKELDRRSNDWSLKLEKFQAEEQRLRERVRELAEQNVSLQREVSSLSGREAETRSRIMNLELQLNDMTVTLEEVKMENQNLRQSLSELRERSDSVEAERDCIKRSYEVKEKENMELRKIVVRLQRVCNENEKTISGLRMGFSGEIGKQNLDGSDIIIALQLEQLRITGVEQTLRKEVESCRSELESLRSENICLLDRLKNATTGSEYKMLRVDTELHSRIECLQNQGLSLLHENTELCGKLLELVESHQFKQGHEMSSEFDGYSVVEHNLKFHSLKRGVVNLKRSLQILSKVLDEKSHAESFEGQSQCTAEDGPTKQGKIQPSEGDIELELKAECLLTRVLREKLCSKEVELEQLQSELASSIRGHDVLRSEIQRLQDELSSLTHRAKDMELQMSKKDERFNQLEHDFEDCMKELNVSRGILPKVTAERDHLWQEVKRLKETDMLLKYEVDSLKKKIETLEEDILIREGQITILKDSLDSKPFNILCNPDSLKEYALE